MVPQARPMPPLDLIISNTEYISWKEKLIQRRQIEDSTYKNLDDFTEPFEFKLPTQSNTISTNENSTPSVGPDMQNVPELGNFGVPSHEGSLSFTAPSQQFNMPPPQQKMSSNAYLNQSLPTTNPPPGFGNFESQNMNSFDASMGGMPGGLPSGVGTNPANNYSMFSSMPPLPPVMNQYPLQQDGMIQSVKNTGRLKFFDEVKNYGFLIVDRDSSDLFVHYDDLKDAKLSRYILRQAKTNFFLQFSFDIAFYNGKYKESRKAVNLKLLKIE